MSIGTHVEVDAGSLCTENFPVPGTGSCSENGMSCSHVSCAGSFRRVVFESRSKHDRYCQGYSRPPNALRAFFLNAGTSSRAPEQSGKPPSPAMSRRRDGAFVVVGARESRVQGEGRQEMSGMVRSRGKAMYIATGGNSGSRANWPPPRAPATGRQHLWRARCISKGARRVR